MQYVSRHLSTHSNVLAVLVYLVDNLLQEPEKSRMAHVRQRRDSGIASVGGQEILDKVIGSDAEKIQFFT